MTGTAQREHLIVGGGPAGALVALLLARTGRSVVLVERGARFRGKACGGCLAPAAVELLGACGLAPPMRRLEAEDGRIRFRHYRGATVVTEDTDASGGRCGAVVCRRRFDQWLVDAAAAAGAQVLQPATVTGLRRRGREVEATLRGRAGDFQIRSRLVIGADGLGSVTARRLGLADRRAAGRKYGFAVDLPLDADPGLRDVAPHGIDMLIVPDGYVGVVRATATRVHVGALVGRGRSGRRDPIGFLRDASRRHPTLATLIERGLGDAAVVAAGPMPWRPDRVADDGVALIGDAAGYVEPFTGEGMSWALRSAALLASVVEEAGHGGWSATVARRYADRHAAELRSRQRLCGVITRSIERPRLAALLFGSAARHPRLVRPLVRRVLGA